MGARRRSTRTMPSTDKDSPSRAQAWPTNRGMRFRLHRSFSNPPAPEMIASFDASTLHDHGFSAETLYDAGFSVGEMVAAGYEKAEIEGAGFEPAILRAASLRRRGSSGSDVLAAGFSVSTCARAGYSAFDLLDPGHPYLEGFDLILIDFKTLSSPTPRVDQTSSPKVAET